RGARRAYRGGCGLAHVEPLLLHRVLARVVGGDRAERTRADVERDRGTAHAGAFERREQRVREMEPGRWRRHGAVDARVDGLVALDVLGRWRVVYVRRQRYLTLRTQRRIERAGDHADDTLALLALGLDLDGQCPVRRRQPCPW